MTGTAIVIAPEVVEGVVEDVEPRQIGPGNVPGPLEPTVIDRVEAARQLRKELRERYPGVSFSVRSDRVWYPTIRVEYEDGPPRDEVYLIAKEYVGYYDDGDSQSDYYHYSPLPGKWVGGQFIRYDVARLHVHRCQSANRSTRTECVELAERVMASQEQGDRYFAPKTTTYLNMVMMLLGLNEREVVKLLKAGEIAATKAHGRWQIDLASLRAYAAARKEREP
jgi:hypothetical protein